MSNSLVGQEQVSSTSEKKAIRDASRKNPSVFGIGFLSILGKKRICGYFESSWSGRLMDEATNGYWKKPKVKKGNLHMQYGPFLVVGRPSLLLHLEE